MSDAGRSSASRGSKKKKPPDEPLVLSALSFIARMQELHTPLQGERHAKEQPNPMGPQFDEKSGWRLVRLREETDRRSGMAKEQPDNGGVRYEFTLFLIC